MKLSSTWSAQTDVGRREFRLFAIIAFLRLLMAVSSQRVQSNEIIASSGTGIPKEPEFGESIKNITVKEGRDAILSCVVDNLGKYKVGWLKLDTQTILSLQKKVIIHNPRVIVTHDEHRTWNLHIRSVKESDGGCYMCQLNTVAMKSKVGCITVQVPPDITDIGTSSETTVNEGDDVTLRCNARGVPPPTIKWLREDRVPIRAKGTIRIEPKVEVNTQLMSAPVGTNVKLECHVQAFPHPIIYWQRQIRGDEPEMILQGSKFESKEEFNSTYTTYTKKMTLVVKNFSRDDAGQYLCVAKNSLGESQTSLRLYVIASPPTKSPTFVSIIPKIPLTSPSSVGSLNILVPDNSGNRKDPIPVHKEERIHSFNAPNSERTFPNGFSPNEEITGSANIVTSNALAFSVFTLVFRWLGNVSFCT